MFAFGITSQVNESMWCINNVHTENKRIDTTPQIKFWSINVQSPMVMNMGHRLWREYLENALDFNSNGILFLFYFITILVLVL